MFRAVRQPTLRSFKTLPRAGFSSEGRAKAEIDFPLTLNDLNEDFRTNVKMLAPEIPPQGAYHRDPEYRKRVNEIREISAAYQTGGDLPRIEYTKDEHATWAKLYSALEPIHVKHACEEHNEGKLKLEKAGVFRCDRIPDIHELSEYLEEETGFSLRPVVSIMEARQFLNSFSFKVFHSTQYIRHRESYDFAEEPDLCHEFLGHCPMLVNKNFVEFAHELGLATMGATEEEMKKLTAIFWYTFEFGLCGSQNEEKVFGAGIIASPHEIISSIKLRERHREFDLNKMSDAYDEMEYTSHQLNYFVAPSFSEVADRTREYSRSLKRPFSLDYDESEKHLRVKEN